jgi:hypothetical protein
VPVQPQLSPPSPCAVLCCAVLCCAVLCCAVLCCAVLCCAVLLLQVVSAHAASIGDNLLGVPLNCSAGLNGDAVALLQEAGMWQAAAALTARTLTGTERAQALSRWASHVREHEGSTWRCVGILTAAGCLQAAAQVGRRVATMQAGTHALNVLKACCVGGGGGA